MDDDGATEDVKDGGDWFCSEAQALPVVVESLDVFAGHLTSKVRRPGLSELYNYFHVRMYLAFCTASCIAAWSSKLRLCCLVQYFWGFSYISFSVPNCNNFFSSSTNIQTFQELLG